MKKGIALGIALLTMVVLAYIYRWETVGMLQKDAYAFPDLQIIQTIQNQVPRSEEKEFDLIKANALDTIYQRAGALYLGDAQVPIRKELPLYMMDGTVLYNLKEEIPVVANTFEQQQWYFDMYESDGVLFHSDGQRADPFTYILGQLDTGVYMNFQEMTIANPSGIVTIPSHSIQGFGEEHILYYQYNEGRMVGAQIPTMGEESTVTIGKDTYGYYDFLVKLGLRQAEEKTETPSIVSEETAKENPLNEKIKQVSPILMGQEPVLFMEAEVAPLPVKTKIEKPQEEKELPILAQPQEKEKVVTNGHSRTTQKPPVVVTPTPQAPQETPPAPVEVQVQKLYKPKLTLAPFYSNAVQRWVETTLGVFDPSGRLTGDIVVYVEDAAGNVFEQSVSNYAFAKTERLLYGLLFYDLPHGQTFTAYGTFSYYNENDELITERFGEQQFSTDYSLEHPPTNLEEPPPEEEDDKSEEKYIEPIVSVAPFTAGVYDIRSNITIEDPQNRIANGVLVELQKDGKVYMRRYATATGVFALTPVHPDSTYNVIVTYEYKNEYQAKVKKEVLTQTVMTLPVSALEPLALLFQNGPIYSTSLQIDGIEYANEKNTTIPYVAKLAVKIAGKEYSMDAVTFKKIGTQPVSFVSPKVFNPSTPYDYELRLYDRFGNVLPVVVPLTGTTKTSKGEPVANLKIVSNVVSKTEIKIDIQDKFQTITGNVKLIVIDKNGNPVVVSITNAQGQEEPVATEHVLDSAGGSIILKDLLLKEKYDVLVIADYDLEDSRGIQQQKQIGKITLITASIEELGKVFLSGKIMELTSTGGTFQLKLDSGVTNPLLVQLLSQVTIKMTDPNGATTYVPVCADWVDGNLVLNEENFEQFKQRIPFQFTLDSLESMTTYKVEILAQVMVNQVYNVPTVFSFDQLQTTFKTLKKDAFAQINNWISGANSIDLFDVFVADPDGAVLGGAVTLKVTNQSGVVVASKVLKTNQLYSHINIPKLSINEKYSVEFFAAEYNTGYTFATQKDLYRLEKSYEIETNGGLWGRLRLQGLSTYNSVKNTYQASLGVTIQDQNGLLGNQPQYILKAYKNNATTPFDSKVYDIGSFAGADRIAQMIATYEVQKQNNFVLELWVNVGGNEIKLDELTFDSNGEIIGLRTEADFAKLNSNPKGRYVVLNDVIVAGNYVTNSNAQFTGSLDFQGYKLTLKSDVYLFCYLGNGGVVKNVVVDYAKNTIDPRTTVGAIALSNNGTIQNVFLNYLGGTDVLNTSSGLIARANGATGIIENFVIKLNANVYLRSSFGGVTDSNSGIIRNGYIYASGDSHFEVPPIDMDINYSGGNAGTLVGINNTSGVVENIFTLVDMKTAGGKFVPSMDTFGLVAGRNEGVLRNAYSTGTLSFEGRTTNVYGPAVGSEAVKKNTMAYYVGNLLYNNNYNVKVPLEALRDAVWQQRVLGKQFDVEGTVSVGYYPQVKWPTCMPAQEYIPLPKLPNAENIDIANVVVEKQPNELDLATQKGDPNEKYGVVLVTFRNPQYYRIQTVTIEYLDTEVLKGTLGQVDRDGFSRVWVRVNNPKKFYSEYSITNFTFSDGIGTNAKTYPLRQFLAFVEFFKEITTTADWKAINQDKNQNYQLASDLDFTGVAPKEIVIGMVNGAYPAAEDYDNGAYGYFGKLDGGIYDAQGNLTGMHSIKNMTLNDNALYSGGVFLSLSGSISNLRVENLNINVPKDTRAGFVRIANNGSVIDNVHVDGFYGQSNSFLGSMAGVLKYAELKNSSANHAVLEDAGLGMNMGGLVGYAAVGFIQNNFVDHLQINSDLSEQGLGTGGIIGRFSSTTLRNLYATGKIDTKDINVGGIVGVVENNYLINRVWSDVAIASVVENIGSVVGAYWFDPSGVAPIDGLVLGNISTTNMTTDKIKRGFGNSDVNKNIYAWAGQKKNGKLPQGLTEDGTTIVTTEQLKGDEIYRYIMLGDSFDLSQTGQGILPKLWNMDGSALLPYQEDHYIGQNDIYVKELNAFFYQAKNTVMVTIGHPVGVDIQSLDVQYLKMTTKEISKDLSGTETTITAVVDSVERGLDSYYLVGIGYNNDQTADVREIVDFGESVYKTISSTDEWLNIMKTNGQNLENFEIAGTLDFSSVNSDAFLSNLKIGRLRGIDNATFVGVQRTEILPDRSIFSIISKELKDISFKNIDLTNNSNAGTYFGIVGNCTGIVGNLAFENIKIAGKASTNVAPIGWFSGTMDQIYLKNIDISSANAYVGGLIGTAQDSTVSNVKAEGNITVVGKNYTGGIGGYFRYSQIIQSTMDGLRTDGTYGIVVSGADCTGGMLGYTSFNSSKPFNNLLSIKNAKITGGTYVGGMMGQGAVNSTNYLTPNKVEDVLIVASNNVGGHTGVELFIANGITVKNAKVFGRMNTGGAIGVCNGNTWSIQSLHVLDSVVSTVYDPAYAPYGAVVPIGTNTSYSIGGLVGNGVAVSGTVANTVVSAKDASYVGGAVGYHPWGYIRNVMVLNTDVRGATRVGGIVGQTMQNVVYSNGTNATVTATGNYAGGIAGYMDIHYKLSGGNVPNIRTCYTTSKVTGADYVGGIAGYATEGLYAAANNYGVLFGGNLKATVGQNVDFFLNINPSGENNTNRFLRARVYEGSRMTTPTQVYSPASKSIAPMQATDASRGSTDPLSVTTVQMADVATYSKWGVAYFTDYWITDGLNRAFLPYFRNDVNGVAGNPAYPGLYQEGKDPGTGQYYDVRRGYGASVVRLGGITIPTGISPMMAMMAMSMEEMDFGEPQILPIPDFYLGNGAAKLNIDFDTANEKTYFEVWAQDTLMDTAPIQQRSFTLSYDFTTPIQIKVKDGFSEAVYDIDPKQYCRTVATDGSKSFYISSNGVVTNGGSTLYGQFVNLRGSEAITKNGTIYNLATGTIKETVTMGICATEPLYRANYEGYDVQTFKNYTDVIAEDGTVTTQPYQMLIKKNTMTVFDPTLAKVYDSVIVDQISSESYCTILGTDGKIVDIKTPIVTPPAFKNERITEMSHNLTTTIPIVILRYENGDVLSFNYVTGELVDLAQVKSDASLLEYLDEKTAPQTVPQLNVVKEGYVDAKLLESYLYIHPNLEELQAALEEMGIAPSSLLEIEGVAMEGLGEGFGTLDLSGENETNGAALVDGEGQSTNLSKMMTEDGVFTETDGISVADGEMAAEAPSEMEGANSNNQPGNFVVTEENNKAQQELAPTSSLGSASTEVPLAEATASVMPTTEGVQAEAETIQAEAETTPLPEQEGIHGAQEGIMREQEGVYHEKNKGGTTMQSPAPKESAVSPQEENEIVESPVPSQLENTREAPETLEEHIGGSEGESPAESVIPSAPPVEAPTQGLGTVEDTRQKYISVYDAKAKKYKIFDEKQLLTQSQTKPLLFVNTVVKEAVQNKIQSSKSGLGFENKGVVFLIGAFTSIGGLLLFVYTRKKSPTGIK